MSRNSTLNLFCEGKRIETRIAVDHDRFIQCDGPVEGIKLLLQLVVNFGTGWLHRDRRYIGVYFYDDYKFAAPNGVDTALRVWEQQLRWRVSSAAPGSWAARMASTW